MRIRIIKRDALTHEIKGIFEVDEDSDWCESIARVNGLLSPHQVRVFIEAGQRVYSSFSYWQKDGGTGCNIS